MSTVSVISSSSLSDLLKVSVDVSQSRLAQLLDSVLERLHSLESKQSLALASGGAGILPVPQPLSQLGNPSPHTAAHASAPSQAAESDDIDTVVSSISTAPTHAQIVSLQGHVHKLEACLGIKVTDVSESDEALPPTRLDVVEESIAQVRADDATVQQRVETVEKRLDDTVTKVTADVSEAKTDLEEGFITQFDFLQRQVDKLALRLQSQAAEHDDKVTALSQQYDAVITRLDASEARATQAEAAVSSLQEQLDANTSTVADALRQLSDRTAANESAIEDLFARLSLPLTSLHSRVDGLDDHRVETAKDLEVLSQEYKENNARLASAISALQLRVLDLTAGSETSDQQSTRLSSRGLSNSRSDSATAQHIQVIIAGVTERLDAAENGVAKMMKVVKDHQSTADRQLIAYQKNIRFQMEETANRLQNMQKNTRSQLSRQLCDFERDLIFLLDARQTTGSTTAAGRGQVRCLACDQSVGDVAGPHSSRRDLLHQLQSQVHAHALAVESASLGLSPDKGAAQGAHVVDQLNKADAAAAASIAGAAASMVDHGDNGGFDHGGTSIVPVVPEIQHSRSISPTSPQRSHQTLSPGKKQSSIRKPDTRPSTEPGSAREDSLANTGTLAAPSAVLPLGLASSRSLMVVSKGGEVGVEGTDGSVYRGRTNTRVLFAPTGNSVNTKFSLAYTDKIPAHALPSVSASLAGSGVQMTGIGSAQSATPEMGPFAAVKAGMGVLPGTGSLSANIGPNSTFSQSIHQRIRSTGDDVSVSSGFFKTNQSINNGMGMTVAGNGTGTGAGGTSSGGSGWSGVHLRAALRKNSSRTRVRSGDVLQGAGSSALSNGLGSMQINRLESQGRRSVASESPERFRTGAVSPALSETTPRRGATPVHPVVDSMCGRDLVPEGDELQGGGPGDDE